MFLIKKGILCSSCLADIWISYFHQKKQLFKATVTCLVFLTVISFILSILTMITFAVMLELISNLMGIGVTFDLSLLTIFLLFLLPLLFIILQNLFEPNFNLPKIIKRIINALFYKFKGTTYERVVFVLVLFIVLSVITFITTIHFFQPFVNTNIISQSWAISLSFAFSLIIIFLISVYGTFNYHKRLKRKFILISLAFIVTFISTAVTVSKLFAQDVNHIYLDDFLKLIVSSIGLVLSANTFVSTLDELILTYLKDLRAKNKCEYCDGCDVRSLTPDKVFSMIKISKEELQQARRISFKKKVFLIFLVCLNFSVIGLLFASSKVISNLNIETILFSWIDDKIMIVIAKILLGIFTIVMTIIGMVFLISSTKELITYRKSKLVTVDLLLNTIKKAAIGVFLLHILIIALYQLLTLRIFMMIFSTNSILIGILWGVYGILWMFNKFNKKVEEYKNTQI